MDLRRVGFEDDEYHGSRESPIGEALPVRSMTPRRLRRVVLVVSTSAVLLAAPAPPTTATADDVVSRGCRELAAVVTVPAERVRPYVPEEYVLTTFPGNAAGHRAGGGPVTDLMVRSFHCDEQVVDGVTRRNTTSVSFGPQVAFPEDEARMGFFNLFWVTDNPELVRWLRRGTGMPQVHHVPTIRSTLAPVADGAGRVVIDVPLPAPWPFRLEGVATTGFGAGMPLVVHWWAPVPGDRTLKLTNRLPRFDLGAAAAGRVSAEPGTPMSDMFDGAELHAYFFAASFDEQTTTKSITEPPIVP